MHNFADLEELFNQASDLDEAARRNFIAQLQQSNPETAAELIQLLQLDRQLVKDNLMTVPPPMHADRLLQADSMLGRTLGAYTLTELIGCGGMGNVYLAQRTDQEYEKHVAIKVVQIHHNDQRIQDWFRSERQILANLEHPDICRLLDGGTDQQGRPYLVMEYVKGKTITEYCDSNRLNLKQRLRLFQKLCNAVSHAHRNLVIHRDIKPSNVLVTDDGQLKLMDFGIAALTQADADNQDTASSILHIQTPGYASPEQVKGLSCTTGSDIYSLGVLLYELLVGQRPFSLTDLSPIEAQTTILKSTAPAPSTRVLNPAETADAALPPWQSRRLDSPGQLSRHLRGDLDAIISKCLNKDSSERYSSVEKLSADVTDYLALRPVLARNGHMRYRLAKFIRRHRVGVAVAAIVITSTGYQQLQLLQERDSTVLERDKAEQIKDFMVELFEVSDPSESRGNSITVREVLDRGAQRIDSELQEQPEIQAELMATIGSVYGNLGLYEQGETLIQRALDNRIQENNGETLEAARDMHSLGELFRLGGNLQDAERFHRQALTIRQRLLGNNHQDTAISMSDLGITVFNLGKNLEAKNLYEQALALYRELPGDNRLEISSTLNNLAQVNHLGLNNHAEAEPLYRESLVLIEQLFGKVYPERLTHLSNLAQVLWEQGNPVEAETMYREVLTTRRQLLGDRHAYVARVSSTLGLLLTDMGQYAEAQAMYQQALDIFYEQVGENHWFGATVLTHMADLQQLQGNYLESEQMIKRAISIFEQALPADHWRLAYARSILGISLAGQGDYQQAEQLLAENYRVMQAALSEKSINIQNTLKRLVKLYELWDKPKRADSYKANLVNRLST